IETHSLSPYGMTFTESNNLLQNIKKNNNIVMKNISVFDSLANHKIKVVRVGNTHAVPVGNMQLSFSVPFEQEKNSILKYATVQIDIGHELRQKWIAGERQGEGIRMEADSLISVLSDKAWIGNIPLAAEEFHA